MAVKTASSITRGFISVTKSGNRAVKRAHEGTWRREAGIAVLFMINSSAFTGFSRVVSFALSAVPNSQDPRGRFRGLRRLYLDEFQFADLERRGLLHAGRAGHCHGFSACTFV
jgi:hypothetical protein